MKKLLLSLLLLMVCLTGCDDKIPNRMSGSMRYVEIGFPRDEGDHYLDPRYGDKTVYKEKWWEWWYFNGKLKTTNNRNFGYMVVVFHYKSKGTIVTSGNMLITDLDNKKSYFSCWPANHDLSILSQKKLDIQLKGFLSDGTTIDNGNFYKFHSYSSKPDTKTTDDTYSIITKGKALIEPSKGREEEKSNMGLDLILERDIEPLIINGNGIMDMPDGGDSYYYTFPHLKTGGKISVGNETFKVASGDSWMDHQWGDFDLINYGWEWFSLRLENGIYANVFVHVDKNRKVVDAVANFVMPDNERKVLRKDEVFVTAREDHWTYNAEELSDHSGINDIVKDKEMNYPQTFTIDFPSIELSVTAKSVFPLQYGYWYWEGFSNVYATWNGEKLSGFSFTEIFYPVKEMID